MVFPNDAKLEIYLKSEDCAFHTKALFDSFSSGNYDEAAQQFESILTLVAEKFSLKDADLSGDNITHIVVLALKDYKPTRESHFERLAELTLILENEELFARFYTTGVLHDELGSKRYTLTTLQSAFIERIPANNEQLYSELTNSNQLIMLRDNLIAVIEGLKAEGNELPTEWLGTYVALQNHQKTFSEHPDQCRQLSTLFEDMHNLQDQLIVSHIENGLRLPQELRDNQALLDKHHLPNIRELQQLKSLLQQYISEMQRHPPSPLAKQRYQKRLDALSSMQKKLFKTFASKEELLTVDLSQELAEIKKNGPSLWERPLLKAIGSLFKRLFKKDAFIKETSTGRQNELGKQLQRVGMFKPSNETETSFSAQDAIELQHPTAPSSTGKNS